MKLSKNKIICFLSLLGGACGASNSLRRGLLDPGYCSISEEDPVMNSCGPEGSMCLQGDDWASQYGTGQHKNGAQIQGSAALGWWDAGDWATYGPVDFGSDDWVEEITFRFTSNPTDEKEHGDQYVEVLVSTSKPSCPDEDWDTFGTRVATIEPEISAQGQMILQTIAIEELSALTGEVYITLLCKTKEGGYAWGFWNLDYFYVRPLSDVGGSCGADGHCSTGICDEVAETCLSGLGGACETDVDCAEGICHSDKCVSDVLTADVACAGLQGSEYVVEIDTVLTEDIDFRALECFTNNFQLRVQNGVTVDCQNFSIIAKRFARGRPAFLLEGDATLKNCRISGFWRAIYPSLLTDPAVPVNINILDSYFEDINRVIYGELASRSPTTVNLVGNYFRDVDFILATMYNSEAATLTISIADSIFDVNTEYISLMNEREFLDPCPPTHSLVFENNTVPVGASKPQFGIGAGNCEFVVELRDGHSVEYVESDQWGSVTILEQID